MSKTINENYIKKLIVLAREINELNKPMTFREGTSEEEIAQARIKFSAKLSYLLGYIEALGEYNNEK